VEFAARMPEHSLQDTRRGLPLLSRSVMTKHSQTSEGGRMAIPPEEEKIIHFVVHDPHIDIRDYV
jgi:hypothetical protein